MKKIYYIIIFILLIALAMVYIQLIDYQKITTSLLQDNKKSNNQIKELKNTTATLEIKNEEFQTQINLLEENLTLQKQDLEKEDTFNTSTDDFSLDLENKVENPKNSLDPSVSPNITIDDENEVTGFGLQYTQKF